MTLGANAIPEGAKHGGSAERAGIPADQSKLILELREKTGAGMMDCKKALAEAGGSLEAALTALRKKGLADAAKKSARVTKEGVIAFAAEGRSGALIELNCETDFVARGSDFQELASELARRAASGSVKTDADARSLIQPVFEKLGENMTLRRLERYEMSGPGLLAGYAHRPDGVARKGAIVELAAPSEAAAKSPELAALAQDLLLQIVGFSPRYLDRSGIPAEDIQKEKEIYTDILRKEGKPEAQIPKIIEGKLNKLFYQANCLLDQISERHDKKPISDLVAKASAALGGTVTVRRFTRYQLGE